MSIQKDMSELLQAGIINQDTADKIQDYYKEKSSSSTNRLFVVFGILGAILVGLGVILIIAHNWDDLSRTSKTVLAFVPLVIGQALCVYTIYKKSDSLAWREGSGVFLFFAVGASISLVSQIYNIPGNLGSFLFTWMFLCLPLIYLIKSSVVSLLYLIGIIFYACETSYWGYPYEQSYAYWAMLIFALPHYYQLYLKKPGSNFTIFQHWIIPLSVTIVLGTLSEDHGEFMYIAYMSFFGLCYLIGSTDFFSTQKFRNNGYQIIGSLGSIVLLLMLSFDWFWEDLVVKELVFSSMILSPEFIAATVFTFLSVVLWLRNRPATLRELKPLSILFLLFIPIFIMGTFSEYAVVFINLSILAVGLMLLRHGAQQTRLGLLNFGLLIIAALVACRFFDTDLSFIIRGTMFLGVGGGFFAANYWMLKKRMTHE